MYQNGCIYENNLSKLDSLVAIIEGGSGEIGAFWSAFYFDKFDNDERANIEERVKTVICTSWPSFCTSH